LTCILPPPVPEKASQQESESVTELSEKHYVAYHSVDERGSHLHIKGGSGVFETNKASLPSKGDVLWCFEGQGKPKRYQLMIRGIVTRMKRKDGEASLVYYHGPADFFSIDVTSLPWFKKLAKSQGSFSFGLNAIRDPQTVEELERFVAGNAVPRTRHTDLFRIQYRNHEAEGWIDFYPLRLFTDKKSGPILYRCQKSKQRFIAKATLDFGEGYADLITDKEEAAKLNIYPGTARFFLEESRGSIKISEVRWADPGKKFVVLEPGPIVDLMKADEIEKQREIDRLDRLAKHRPEQAKFRGELFSIYNGTCAVTGCSIPETLQAAHLETVDGKDINDPRNGILLRADIHQLFDAGLFSLSRDGLQIDASELLTDNYYLGFNGAPVFRPPSFAPSEKHIDAHRRTSGFSIPLRIRKKQS
jgi:hypothetical protein